MLRLLAAAALLSPAYAHAQTVTLPDQLIAGEPATFRIDSVPANALVALEVRAVDADGRVSVSRNEFKADANGRVDPAMLAPVRGYAGVDPAGPFWSMAPQRPPASADARNQLTVRVLRNDTLLAETHRPYMAAAENVRSEEVAAFPGARLYRPDDGQRRPLIIALGGSEGGASFGRTLGPRLAARGYAVLALPYYNAGWGDPPIPGLPNAFADIPVDRLRDVRAWAQRRSDLDSAAIGLYGVSKGGEFAMIAAARFPWLKAVIGIVPSDVVWEGWGTREPEGTRSSFSWQGKPLPFTPYRGMAATFEALGRGERAVLAVPHLEGRRAFPDRAALARIPVETYRGPMLVAGGDRDQTWPSGEMVRAIAERRAAAGRVTVALSFADAGHGLSGTGWSPLAYPGMEQEVAANARAQQQIWSATLTFLRQHLPTRP